MYPAEMVAPFQSDLTDHGFEALNTSESVKEVLDSKEGTVLVVVNSVCGCAASNARPGAKLALQNEKTPTRLTTVFAGVDKDAVNTARMYMMPYPPSSPSIALFKDGKLVHFIERHQIEGRMAQHIAENLKMAFDQHC